jgi:hypothetical protein
MHRLGAAWSAWVGRGPDPVVGGRDDRGRVDHAAGRLACGGSGGVLPWALLWWAVRRAWPPNVAVAQPTPAGRVIAAWPSFALIGALRAAHT